MIAGNTRFSFYLTLRIFGSKSLKQVMEDFNWNNGNDCCLIGYDHHCYFFSFLATNNFYLCSKLMTYMKSGIICIFLQLSLNLSSNITYHQFFEKISITMFYKNNESAMSKLKIYVLSLSFFVANRSVYYWEKGLTHQINFQSLHICNIIYDISHT